MTPAEWEQVKCVFEAASALPESEWEAYVSAACDTRTLLRQTVLELLRHDTSRTSYSGERRPQGAPVMGIGDLIAGRFRISRFIASGGMGEVYEAYDEWLQVRLALKTVRPELISDPEALERFKRELLVARRVSHDNVCRVFDFAEHRHSSGVTPCFTMELLDGESLAEYIVRQRPVPTGEALPLLRQIACGLEVLHRQGIVHRDLKPSNIMIVRRGERPPRIVVTDFGLAKSDGSETDLFQSAPDFQGGAPYFMAPELLKCQPPSVASDVYSFGLLIDELVTSSRAFSCDSLQSLYYEKLWGKPQAPSARANGLPSRWGSTIMRCLDAEPAARFAGVSDVVAALEEAPAIVHPDHVEGSTAAPPQKERRIPRRAAIAALIATPVVGGTAAIAAIALQPVTSSIGVFQIENQTNLPDYDYLCTGTTAELKRQLLQLQGVRIYGLSSPRSLAGKQRAGRFALEGLLQAAQGQIRLSMQLSDNQNDGALLWSENFDRRGLGDPLALQTEIAQKTVAAVERRLLLGSHDAGGAGAGPLATVTYRVRQMFSMQAAAALPGPPTKSPTAFDLYMRGHNLLEELSPDTATAAIDYFKRAIKEDPDFALAYSSTADAYMALMNYNYVPHPDLAKYARQYAARSVEIDDNLAEAQMVLAAVRQMDWDWQAAETSYRRALTLKPNMARAHRWYAGFVLQFGRFDEALRGAQHSLELDPYDRSGPPSVALYLYFAGRYKEALDMLESRSAQDMPATHHHRAQIYGWLGHSSSGAASDAYFTKALEASRHCEALEREASQRSGQPGGTSYSDQLFALVYALKGDLANADVFIARLEAEMADGKESPATIGWVRAILGQRDRACDLLEQAATWRDRRLLYTKVIPYLSSLHGFPRYQALLRQMNLG